MRSDRNLLNDARDAIDVVARVLPEDRAAFDANEMLQSHIYRHVMIVGEAMWRLSQGLKDKHPEVPWRQIQGMRHILVHDYFRVDWDIVFSTAKDDLPELRSQIVELIDSLPTENLSPESES